MTTLKCCIYPYFLGIYIQKFTTKYPSCIYPNFLGYLHLPFMRLATSMRCIYPYFLGYLHLITRKCLIPKQIG